MVATTERAITADGAGERDRYTLSVLAEIEWDGAVGVFSGATKYGEVCDGPVPTPERRCLPEQPPDAVGQ